MVDRTLLKGILYLLCAFTLAGTSVVAARFVTGSLGPFTITAVSLLFALVCLLPLGGRKLVPAVRALTPRRLIALTLQALCGIFLFRLFLLLGLARTSAAEAGILTGAAPAITALLAAVALAEPLRGGKLAGMLCTVAGVALIQGAFLPEERLALAHIGGNLLVLCAAASESAFNVLSRRFVVQISTQAQEPIHPVAQTALVTAIALVFSAVPALFEQPLARLLAIEPVQWLALAWYGAFVTALAFLCWYQGIRRCGALTAAAFSGMMPFTAMMLSALVLRESLQWHQWAGGGLVMLGMLLIALWGPRPARQGIQRRQHSL